MNWSESGSAGSVILALAMVAVTFFLLRRSYRYFGRRSKGGSAVVRVPRPKNSRSGLPADALDELTRQEVQLHERERDVSARLDSKIGVLQHLIRQAQETIARLESLIADAEPGSDRGESDSGADATSSPSAVARAASDSPDAAVYSLADQGLSAVTIAHQVGKPLVEIEAILSDRHVT